MTDLILFAVGVAMVAIALYLQRATKRASMMSKGPRYSKSLKRAIFETGIYTEHGMVLDKNGVDVIAESKKSRTFYESFI